MLRKILLITLASATFACGSPAFTQTDIRSVDFKNFTYEVACLSESPIKVPVKDGEFQSEKEVDGYIERFYFFVGDIAYGDLTGDGKDEAIVIGACNTGGSGNFSEGFVFAMQGGGPALIARIPGGDRAYGGLRSTRVEDGILVVESNDAGERGGACCPEFVVTNRYKVSDGKLIPAGASSRRELYPKEPIKFPKGSTGVTFNVKMPAQEIKRFSVTGRAGQRLMVSTDTDNVTLRLLEDVRVVDGINNFTAHLNKNGEYTIELQNITDEEQEITLNVKIP